MRQLLYIVGVPGSGKTSLLRATLNGVSAQIVDRPFAWTRYPGGAQLGAERGVFSGTDILPLNVQPRVLGWLSRSELSAVIAEGDRLANATFFDALRTQGWKLSVVTLDCSPALAATRREVRRAYQSPSWLRGRQTKVHTLGAYYGDPAWRLDAHLSLEVLAAQLRAHPIVKEIAGWA